MPNDRIDGRDELGSATYEQVRADMPEHEATYAAFARASRMGIIAAPLLLAFVLYWTT